MIEFLVEVLKQKGIIVSIEKCSVNLNNISSFSVEDFLEIGKFIDCLRANKKESLTVTLAGDSETYNLSLQENDEIIFLMISLL